LSASVVRADPSAQDIMDKVENRYQGKDLKGKVTLQVNAKGATPRFRQFVLLRKEYPKDKLVKLVTFILAPPDVRNSAFLVFDRHGADDLRWLYLPAVGQIRQMTATGSRQSFFGTDLVNEDLTNRDPDLDNHKLVGAQKVYDWECWLVESTPKDAQGLDFATYKTWVWKDTSLLVRQEYYDSGGKLLRRIDVKDIQKVQGIPTWHHSVVTNEKTGSVTKMEVSEVSYDNGLDDETFSQAKLDRGAPN
jgi:outer membrane lipoprotein-sorting protein